MSPEDQEQLKHLLTAEMVSRVSLAEAVNIMHNLAVSEVSTQVEKMSNEEKEEAFKELSEKLNASVGETSQETKEETK
jgi:hypothetical protein